MPSGNNTEFGRGAEIKDKANPQLEASIDGAPVCAECGNIKIQEEGEWLCPHCQGEIDFLGEDDD